MENLHLIRRLVRHGTLPQLAAFEAIVRLGSYTRAAECLCMAQPTISGHIRKLTEAVGQPLLVIEDRQVQPTAAGLALLDAVRDIFAALARAERALSAAPDPEGVAQRTVYPVRRWPAAAPEAWRPALAHSSSRS